MVALVPGGGGGANASMHAVKDPAGGIGARARSGTRVSPRISVRTAFEGRVDRPAVLVTFLQPGRNTPDTARAKIG